MTTIKLKNGSGAPTAGDLVQGEPALDLTNKRLYTENASGTVIEVGTNPGTDVTFADNRKATFGDSSDLQIYHDASHSYIVDAGTGNMYLSTNGNGIVMQASLSETMFSALPNGSVRLYYDNSQKLETTSTGIDVTGSVVSDGLTVDASTAVVQASNAGGTTSFEISNTNGVSTLYNKAALYLSATGAEANAARIESQFTGTVATNHAQELKFYTVDTGSSPVERMKISSGGDVAVGTAAVTGGRYFDIYNTGSTATDFAITRFITQQVGSSSTTSADIYKRKNGEFGFANNDTDSAAYINFKVGTSDRMRIDSSGNVGIGATSLSNKLTVNGDQVLLANGELKFADATNNQVSTIRNSGGSSTSQLEFLTASTERMRIDSSGNVGIGTASPTANLEISAATSRKLDVVDTTGARVRLSTASGQTYVGSTTAHPLNIITNDAIRATIDSSGNVGFGTSSPRYNLAVSGNNATAIGIALDNASGSGTADISILGAGYASHQAGAGEVWFYSPDNINIGGATGNTNNIKFLANNNINMFIEGSSGNVGIGTASPSSYNSAMDDLVVAGSADSGITIASGTSSEGSLAFADGTSGADAYRGWINYNHNSNFMRFSTNATERMRIDSLGLVGINKSASFGAFLDIDNTGATTQTLIALKDSGGTGTHTQIQFSNTNGVVGSINTAGSATAYNTSSDQRLKENIVDAPSASDDIDAIQVRSFDWKADGSHQKYGLIAQELNTVAPDAVTEGETEEDMMAVDYSKLVPMLVKEIQSLRARVAQLEGAN